MVKGTVCENVPALIDWLTSQAKKTPGLTIKTKTTVTPDFVRAMKPDAVIVATGGVYGAPDVPGIDLGIVSTVPQLTRLAEKPLKLFGANAINKLSQIALPGIGKNCVVLGAQIEGVRQGRRRALSQGRQHPGVQVSRFRPELVRPAERPGPRGVSHRRMPGTRIHAHGRRGGPGPSRRPEAVIARRREGSLHERLREAFVSD